MNAMPREQVFALIQAHLADELDVEPTRIGEGTRFREDLEADSLDRTRSCRSSRTPIA